MKTTGMIGSLKAVVIIATFVIGGALPAQAGQTSVYLKSGWFSWDETVNGSPFVKENGMLHGAGVARKDDVPALSIAELVEVWGGSLDYDGHDVTGSRRIESDTVYLGTREEVDFSLKLSGKSTLSMEPFAGLGHKFWIRTRSSEDWNTFYGKAGVGARLTTAAGTLFLKGGAMMPIYTRTHVSLSDAGFTDVVTEPRSRVSAFAEGGLQIGGFAVSVEYEGMEFGESARVPTATLSSAAKGVAVTGLQAYQPKSSSSLFSLKVAYSF